MAAIARYFLGFAVLPLICGSCSRGDSEASWWEQEHQRIELARQIELAEYRLARAEASFIAAEEHAQWLAACEAADLRATQLRARKKELERQIQTGLDQLADYQRLAIEHRRKEMRNLEIDYLELDDRRTFLDVRVVSIDTPEFRFATATVAHGSAFMI